MYCLRASASQKGLKGQIRDLKQQLKRPAPFVGPLTHKLFSLVLKSFQSFLACRGSQKLRFVDLGLT